MKITDQEIIQAVKEGEDDLVLEYLYRTVLPNVMNFILKNSGSEEEAKDIFQDAIVTFFRLVIKGKFNEKYKVSGFLFTYSKNRWINRYAKIKRSDSLDNQGAYIALENTEESVIDKIENEEKQKMIEFLLSELNDRCKELITYTIYHKKNMKEIADIMNFASENAAKTQNYRCKQKLIEIVKKYPGLERWLKE